MTTQACPHTGGCEMYALLRHAGSLATWKINYCEADYSRCARYQRAVNGLSVAQNLMPNGALLKKPGTGASSSGLVAAAALQPGKKAP